MSVLKCSSLVYCFEHIWISLMVSMIFLVSRAMTCSLIFWGDVWIGIQMHDLLHSKLWNIHGCEGDFLDHLNAVLISLPWKQAPTLLLVLLLVLTSCKMFFWKNVPSNFQKWNLKFTRIFPFFNAFRHKPFGTAYPSFQVPSYRTSNWTDKYFLFLLNCKTDTVTTQD